MSARNALRKLLRLVRREVELTGGTGAIGKPYSCIDCASLSADGADGRCWRCRIQHAQPGDVR